MAEKVERQLVVFDFDWSLVDQDTDRWIFEVLAPHLRRKMRDLKPTMQWTDIVAQSLREIHKEGMTRDDIEEALRILPFHPAMLRALHGLKLREDLDSTFFILSNSNTVFISTILVEKEILDLFDIVITNPAEWDSSGMLKLTSLIGPADRQHKCSIGCSANMCKGEELSRVLSRNKPYDRVIYVGDGSNDFCPAIRLREQDTLLCRTYRGLQRRIEKEGGLRCNVKYWAGAWEVEEFFDQL